MRRTFRIIAFLAIVSSVMGMPAIAQNRVRFPSASTTPTYIPQTAQATSPWAPGTPSPGVVLGQPQPFDPYGFPAAPSGTLPQGGLLGQPNILPPYSPPGYATPPSTLPGGPSSFPNFTVPPLTTPPYPTAPPRSLPAPPLSAPTYPGNQLPPSLPSATPWTPYGSSTPPANFPPTLIPDAGVLPPTGNSYPPPPYGGSIITPPPTSPVFPNGIPWLQQQQPNGNYERLFQDTGMVYTYLWGNDRPSNTDQLEINEVDIFTTAVFNNFGHSSNALRVTPGFTFDFLDGPSNPTKIVLPSALYAAYVDGLWQPQLSPQYSLDLNLRAGVYSDFERFVSDSLRITGRGLGILQLTPTVAVKAGVEYVNRGQVKLFPAGGILWTPDEQTKWDFYFPRPKFSRYWRTVGSTNTDVWWTLGAEYGGGSWTVTRPSTALVRPGEIDQVDINDIRVFTGIEWNRLNRLQGVLEIGYVFSRDIYVAQDRSEDLNLDDTFMARGGIKF